MTGQMGPLVCAGLLALYWLIFGPAPLLTRLVTALIAAAVVAAAALTAHKSTQQWLISWGAPAALGAVALFLCVFWWGSRAPLLLGALLVGVVALLPWELIRMN